MPRVYARPVYIHGLPPFGMIFSAILKLPFSLFPFEIDRRNLAAAAFKAFRSIILVLLSYTLHYFHTVNPSMEIAAVSGTEPSPEQFLRQRGKTRSREKGIVYDPANQSLKIRRIKKIERSSKLSARGIYTGENTNFGALQKPIQTRSICPANSRHPT